MTIEDGKSKKSTVPWTEEEMGELVHKGSKHPKWSNTMPMGLPENQGEEPAVEQPAKNLLDDISFN